MVGLGVEPLEQLSLIQAILYLLRLILTTKHVRLAALGVAQLVYLSLLHFMLDVTTGELSNHKLTIVP
jgi:hypothetical protein